jgi:hypothetical protein
MQETSRYSLLFCIAACHGCADEPAPTPDTAAATGADASETRAQVAAQDADTATDLAAPDVKLQALVFVRDPLTDQGKTATVTLPPPTSDDGTLLGPYADVRNCLREPGGIPLKYQGFKVGKFCMERKTVKPGQDGSYLHVQPPADFGDPGDGFAEVMMYWHVHKAHAFFQEGFALDSLDFPLEALVNVSFDIEPLAALVTGQKAGWNGLANAAFMPKQAFAQFGLPPREKGAIVFGQHEKTDFAYDAGVIYHEYTHAMIGTTRLNGVLPGTEWLDNLPGALNEGFADYFGAAISGNPVIGKYGIGSFAGAHMVRDLQVKRRCPDDLTTEIHADGRIVGSGLWAMRQKVGDKADGIVLRALQSFTQFTSLESAAKLLIAEAKQDGVGAEVEAVLKDHGWVKCERSRPWTDWTADTSPDKVPFRVEGKGAFGGAAMAAGVPGYLQFWLDVPAAAAAATVWLEAGGAFSLFTSGFGAPGSGSDLGLVVGHGAPISLFADGTHTGVAKIPVMKPDPSKNGRRTLTLDASCLPKNGGKVYFMLLNSGTGSLGIDKMGSKLLGNAQNAANLLTCK